MSFGKGMEVGLAACGRSPLPPMEEAYDLKLAAEEGRVEAVVKGLDVALEGREAGTAPL